MSIVYLSLGSNLGNRELTIHRAIELLNIKVGTIIRISSFIETEPYGFTSSNKFINAAVCLKTELTPNRLLDKTKEIEKELGRKEKSVDGCYHDRPIDIDILLYDDLHIDNIDLKIPHPFMHERDFVMKPLMEIYKERE
ncbi:MAG: 2-amino-4-hydroxy-6-hydroxymethyldihydropteridine diphosphokinase [Prevotella sp.]